MSYLLDTNACIMYLNNSNAQIVDKIKGTKSSDIYLCQIVKAELTFGAYNSTRQSDNLALLEKFFAQFTSLLFNDEAVDVYGKIRAALAKAGEPIGPNDQIIAAIAIAHNVTLVTNNTKEFSRIASLKSEDWMQDT